MVGVATFLAGCGGGGGTAPITSGSVGVSASNSFPSGLAVGSPGELSVGAGPSGVSQWDGVRFISDWGRSAFEATIQGDTAQMATLATAILPLGRAFAVAAKPDLEADAEAIDKLLSGDPSASPAALLDLQKIFSVGTNATCYGPTMLYDFHQDAGGGSASGSLPSGDLGLWLPEEGATGTPCVMAQLNRRVSGVKQRTRQGLLMMAVMRHAVAANSLTMPSAGSSLDIQPYVATRFGSFGPFAGVTVDAASVSLDAGGTTYTYRLVLSAGTGASAKSGEIIMRHSPGSSTTSYTGVMQVAGFFLSSDVAFGCSDQTSGALYKVAQVSSLKYSRSGSNIQFGSRDGHYCGAPAASSANHGADVASFTGDGQLDPTVKISGSTQGGVKGWRGNFSRFAGDFDRNTIDGNFIYAWQAGTGDSHSRALSARASYNSATGTRTIDGYFAFAGGIDTTTGSLSGMICNWAGPGNSHTPASSFQYQRATLTSASAGYVLAAPADSKITYAPTNSCSSTTTSFDVNSNGTLAAGEGLGLTSSLDSPSGANTVQQEIVSRGFSMPSLF